MPLNSPSDTAPARRGTSAAMVAIIVAIGLGVALATAGAVVELHLLPGSGSHPSPASDNVTVIDDLGRTIHAPWNAHRVVVLGPNIMDSMFRLGLRPDVVGVDCSSAAFQGLLGDYTSNQTILWNLSTAMCVQAFPQLVPDQILNLSPQLVLVSSELPSSLLEEYSLTYETPVVFLAPTTLGAIVGDLLTLGQLFPAGGLLAPLVASLQSTLNAAGSFELNLSNAGTPYRSLLLTYYVSPSGSPYAGYSTFGPGTFGQSLVELAGGASIAANATTEFPTLSGGQVLAANPSVIICGTGFGLGPAQFAQGPDWSSFPAVQNHNVSYIDVTLITEADATMVLGLVTLVHLLYPTALFP